MEFILLKRLLLHNHLLKNKKTVFYKCQTASLLSIFGLSHVHFGFAQCTASGTLLRPQFQTPCILTLLKHLEITLQNSA